MRSGACALVVGGSLTGGGHCGLSLWRLGLRGAMVGGVLAGVGGGAGVGAVGGGGTYSGRSAVGAAVGCITFWHFGHVRTIFYQVYKVVRCVA